MNDALTFLGIFLYGLLALKLWRSGLLHPYRWLFAYSISIVVRITVPLITGWKPDGDRYFTWWAVNEAISWFLLTVLVLNLCSSVFQQFPALVTWGSRIYKAALAVSITVSLATLFLTSPPEKNQILFAMLAVQRVVLTSLLVMILALLFSMAWYRVPLKRNTIMMATIFFVYFLAKAGVVLVIQSLGIQVYGPVNVTLKVLADLCVLAWIVGLTTAGEKAILSVGHQWNPEEGERLVNQLRALNRTLEQRGAKTPGSVGGIASDLTK